MWASMCMGCMRVCLSVGKYVYGVYESCLSVCKYTYGVYESVSECGQVYVWYGVYESV